MCIAIYKPKGTQPLWENYKAGHDSNPDGWGFAVVHNGRLIKKHGYNPDRAKSFKAFKRAFGPYGGSQALIHFRLATHGTKSTDNCHPFEVTPNLAVIHNGIINIKCDIDAARSDTWHYVQHVLRPMFRENPTFYLASHHRYQSEQAHSGSKFAFLNADGSYGIWNENSGVWQSGHWWSNRRFEACTYKPITRWSYSASSSARYSQSKSTQSFMTSSTRKADAAADALDLAWDGDKGDAYEYEDALDVDWEYQGTSATAVAKSAVHSEPASQNLLVVDKPELIVDKLPVTTALTSVNSSRSTLTDAADFVLDELIAHGCDPLVGDELYEIFGNEGLISVGIALGFAGTPMSDYMKGDRR